MELPSPFHANTSYRSCIIYWRFWGFPSHSRIFHSFPDTLLAVMGNQPFIMDISVDLWHSPAAEHWTVELSLSVFVSLSRPGIEPTSPACETDPLDTTPPRRFHWLYTVCDILGRLQSQWRSLHVCLYAWASTSFWQKKERNKKNKKKKKKEREKERSRKIMERLYDSPLG